MASLLFSLGFTSTVDLPLPKRFSRRPSFHQHSLVSLFDDLFHRLLPRAGRGRHIDGKTTGTEG
jgi:hypothetical protein